MKVEKLYCSVCGSSVSVTKKGMFLEYVCPHCGVLHSLEYEEQEESKDMTTLV